MGEQGFEIHRLYEFEGGSGPVIGVFTDGWVDPALFARRAYDDWDVLVSPGKVEHTYRHYNPQGWWMFQRSIREKTPGWAKTTYYEVPS